MTRIVAVAGVALLFVAYTDANPTRPGPASLHPSFANNASMAASQSYLITTYYWADDGWVEHASWNDPTMGQDAQIWIIARNGPDKYPAAQFTIDNVRASGDTDLPDGVVDDFDDGVIGGVWGGDGTAQCELREDYGTEGCEVGGVFTIDIPQGARESDYSRFFILKTPADVVQGEYDVQMDFSVNQGYHDTGLWAYLWLSVGHDESHHAEIGLRMGRYISADTDFSVGSTSYRRTDTGQLHGKLRVKRTSVRGGGRVVESTTGSGSFRVFTQTDDWRPFSFTASRHADGTVDGEWERIRRQEGTASESKSHGVVTCMVIVGNETWLGGYATSGLWSEPPNNHVAWHVRDNGEGPGSTPDQISLQNVGVSSAYTANYCANAPTNLDLFDLEAGNIQIMRR